jgi:hypothetical protein
LQYKQTLRKLRPIVLWFVFAGAISSFGQTTPPQPAPEANPHSAVRILSPRNGEVLNINIVQCKYEMVKPATPAESPTFQLQLDDQDPVDTVETEYTFTGLKDGPHAMVVMVVDANNFPIPGTENEVHFKVVLPVPPRQMGELLPVKASKRLPARLLLASANAEKAPASGANANQIVQPSQQLPQGSTPLPLLSVLGGGALAGGTISVLRTRARRKKK